MCGRTLYAAALSYAGRGGSVLPIPGTYRFTIA